MISFLDKSGYNNPYTHLRRCYARGKDLKDQEDVLLRLYEEAREAMTQKGGTIRSHFEMQSLSEYEKAIHGYIRLIVMKSLPLYYVSDPEVRNFSRYDVNIGKRTLVEVIFKLVELVEKKIAIELECTKGAVLFDGWTCNSTHYIAVIVSYCTTALRHDRGSVFKESIPRLTLLSLSPMGHVPEEEDENATGQDETTKFNAEAHLQFFSEIFPFFGQEFSKWCLCLIGDNCSTNLKVASLAKKPYVGCNSHKLNLEVNHMVDCHTQLKTTIETVHETMREAKKLKNAALLRNPTDLNQSCIIQPAGQVSYTCFVDLYRFVTN